MRLRFAFKKLQTAAGNPYKPQPLFWARVRAASLVLNTPIATNRACSQPVKQSLEKSVIRDARSSLGKLNPSQVSHFSSVSGWPLTLLHITNKRQIFNIASIPHKWGKQPHSNVNFIQNRDWCCYYSCFAHNILSPSGILPSSPGAFQQNEIWTAI